MRLKEKACCFFGHRKIKITDEQLSRLQNVVEKLIVEKKVDTFLFGSKSEFDDLCLKVVTELKKKYSNIKRIYVRAEHPYVDESYLNYILKSYDDTYYPASVINAGRSTYVKRNFNMIDNSRYCVIYYNDTYILPNQKSGTKIAYEYAMKKRLKMFNVY